MNWMKKINLMLSNLNLKKTLQLNLNLLKKKKFKKFRKLKNGILQIKWSHKMKILYCLIRMMILNIFIQLMKKKK